MRYFKKFLEYFILFSVGFSVYCFIEMAWKGGDTYASMGIIGGLVVLVAGSINDSLLTEKMPIWLQQLIAAIFIVSCEAIAGVLINQDHHIWDYSNLPFNYKGQICLLFSIIWYFLSVVAILIQDYLNYLFFGKNKPHYYFWFNGKLKIF